MNASELSACSTYTALPLISNTQEVGPVAYC
jgi:hypothetical protein